MKAKEELIALKNAVETLSKKFHDLTEEELAQVAGGNVHCGIYIGKGQMTHISTDVNCGQYNNIDLPPKPGEVITDPKEFLNN